MKTWIKQLFCWHNFKPFITGTTTNAGLINVKITGEAIYFEDARSQIPMYSNKIKKCIKCNKLKLNN